MNAHVAESEFTATWYYTEESLNRHLVEIHAKKGGVKRVTEEPSFRGSAPEVKTKRKRSHAVYAQDSRVVKNIAPVRFKSIMLSRLICMTTTQLTKRIAEQKNGKRYLKTRVRTCCRTL